MGLRLSQVPEVRWRLGVLMNQDSLEADGLLPLARRPHQRKDQEPKDNERAPGRANIVIKGHQALMELIAGKGTG